MNQSFNVEPLPPFASAHDAMVEALDALKPVSRVSVREAATKRWIKSGSRWVSWRDDVAPYMNEPMEVVTSRRFDSIAFVGPARSSKSESLVINPLCHAITEQPRTVAVFAPTRDAAKEWSEGTLDPIIDNSPKIKALRAKGARADNLFTKRFRGGCRLTIDWPVKHKLAMRSIALGIATDYDAFLQDVDGDGAVFGLLRKRGEDHRSRAMTIIESSPRFSVLDETWQADTPHQAPPCEGIMSIYNMGSRGRLYWCCPSCYEQFEPRFEYLYYDTTGSPSERGASAYMGCPHCHCVIEAKEKVELNRSAKWLHEDEDGALVELHKLSRPVSIASYWLQGVAAALAPWSQLVTRYLEALEEYNRTKREASLKTVTNVELGLPYTPLNDDGDITLNARALRDKASNHTWQVAPENTAFITAAIDVQSARFVVQVEAWQPELERVVIDRFDIATPPEGAPRASERTIRPPRFLEDWDALLPLFEKSYEVEGATHRLSILALVCDSQGEKGTTPRAYAFYRKMRRKYPNRFYLLRGKGGELVKRAEARRPETAHKGKAHVARDIPIIRIGTDRLKDEIATSLLQEGVGVSALHIPAAAPTEIFEEYASERPTEKGWRKRPGMQRNEALDLSCYNLGLSIILEAESIDWNKPPAWARPGSGNLKAILPDIATTEDVLEATPTRPAQKKKKRKKARRPRGYHF